MKPFLVAIDSGLNEAFDKLKRLSTVYPKMSSTGGPLWSRTPSIGWCGTWPE